MSGAVVETDCAAAMLAQSRARIATAERIMRASTLEMLAALRTLVLRVSGVYHQRKKRG